MVDDKYVRYFIELSYLGTRYSGFQSQHNANTVQAEVEKAFKTLSRENVRLTGSSRTDAGVHALQNFFHFDLDRPFTEWTGIDSPAQLIYKLNAILPPDIAVNKVFPVDNNSHCRFDALGREYKYYLYRKKNPFLEGRAYYFPYKLDLEKLKEAAAIIRAYSDFTSFSKRNTQAKTFTCEIRESEWVLEKDCLVYRVEANRFLRGMVRALVATMLQIGRNKISIGDFKSIIESRDCTRASFAVPGKGLFLVKVTYPY
jgi:tRNA pseudouridine38-40 synthase